jgi:isopenicillin-N epimerase
MLHRRDFFAMGGRTITAATLAAAFQNDSVLRAQSAVQSAAGRPADSVAVDEDFWLNIRHAFTVNRNIINLNNGGVSPSPKIVSDTEKRFLDIENMGPAFYMWRVLDPDIETVRRRLAKEFGVDTEEIAITRNASEALEIVQLGMDLKRGDEIVTTDQDYGRMITTWQQRERRDGLVLKQVSFKCPPPSMDYLVGQVTDAVTSKTKVIHICQITNRTGQIFPVKKISEFAHKRGIEVVVDGAHAFAQFPFKHKDLMCDYYGTSLHKWVLAPIGTGFLYMGKDKISKIWPLMAAPPSLDNNIRKFEEIGTHPASQRNAITEALAFNDSIGIERKAARFRYLRARWSKRLKDLPGVALLTSDDPEQSCAIGLISVKGFDAGQLSNYLMDHHRILTTPIVTEGPYPYSGLRITPNVYTTLEEIDTFSDVMEEIIRKGKLPSAA